MHEGTRWFKSEDRDLERRRWIEKGTIGIRTTRIAMKFDMSWPKLKDFARKIDSFGKHPFFRTVQQDVLNGLRMAFIKVDFHESSPSKLSYY